MTECELLIRHMLIVDANKRYSIAQIKQHKWLIQGEPYEDLVDIEEHRKGENGVCIYNEKVLQQMGKLGEDRAKVINVSFFSVGFHVYVVFVLENIHSRTDKKTSRFKTHTHVCVYLHHYYMKV